MATFALSNRVSTNRRFLDKIGYFVGYNAGQINKLRVPRTTRSRHDCGKHDGGNEGDGELVMAGGDTSPIPEATEHPFDEMHWLYAVSSNG
jgi:hypothetical protein